MFSNDQKAALAAPLCSANVKSRKQAGRSVSYIEGWKAIEEANRIFGFDAWSRETVEVKCVSERERKIGSDKRDGWSVSYIAKVRVTCANNLVREGVGAGHGIDMDCGQAHESAIKEAETDAMKRALMTFGNPFGLALYDKTQANVVDEPEEPDGKAHYIASVREQIRKTQNAKALADWWKSDEQSKARRDFGLSNPEVDELKAFLIARHAELEPKKAVA